MYEALFGLFFFYLFFFCKLKQMNSLSWWVHSLISRLQIMSGHHFQSWCPHCHSCGLGNNISLPFVHPRSHEHCFAISSAAQGTLNKWLIYCAMEVFSSAFPWLVGQDVLLVPRCITMPPAIANIGLLQGMQTRSSRQLGNFSVNNPLSP